MLLNTNWEPGQAAYALGLLERWGGQAPAQRAFFELARGRLGVPAAKDASVDSLGPACRREVLELLLVSTCLGTEVTQAQLIALEKLNRQLEHPTPWPGILRHAREGRGKRATMMASLTPWNAEEKQVIQASMEAVYKTFVSRVAAGRNKKLEEVLLIAQGRVWTGTKAKELGLVDEIGGLDAALDEARKLAKVDATMGLEIYPPSPTLRDVLSSFGQVQAPIGLHVREALASLGAFDPLVADEVARLIKIALSFRATTIQAIAVLPIVR